MRRNIRRFFLFIGLLIVFTIIKFPYDSFSPDVKSRMRDESQKAGVLWDSKNFRFSMPPQIDAEQISGFIKTGNFPIPFVIDSFWIRLPMWGLITFSPTVEAQASLYGGKCHGEFAPQSSGIIKFATLNCEQLNLASHPSLDFLGIQGLVSATLSASSPEKAAVSLHLRNGSVKDPKKLSPFAPPTIDNVSLDCEAEIGINRAQIASVSLHSPLGTVNGRGLLVSNRGFLTNQTAFSAEIRLSDSGQQSIGPYLALAASLPIDTKSPGWQIQLTGSGGAMPIIKVTPIP